MTAKKNTYQKGENGLLAISLTLFVIRLIHAQLLLNHAYLGADGPNYISGFLSIIKEGFLSPDQHLLYWPAGYSIFIYGAYTLVPTDPLLAVSIIQNTLLTTGIYFFSKACSKRFPNRKFILVLCILLNISPMIYSMSLSIGYESILISLYLIILSIYINDKYEGKSVLSLTQLIIIFTCMTIIVGFQPRFLLTNAIIIFYFHIWKRKINPILIGSVIFLLIANLASPLALTLRNHTVHGVYMVSSNLADTLLIGAGDHASGAYNENPEGIPCELDTSSISNREKSLTNCVLGWYSNHPAKAARLFLNKAFFFWSPWSGPLSKGTLGSNPWLKVAPGELIQKNLNSTSTQLLAKFFSLVYTFGYVSLVFIGYRHLLRRKNDAMITRLAHISFVSIFVNMLISMATIGDNRFRVPMIGFIILLQLSGLEYFVGKYVGRSKNKSQ
jgi:hypothetical protein